MKPYSPKTDKGRIISIDDIHHKTADQPKAAAKASAKSMRQAARQEGRRDVLNLQLDD